MSSGDVLSTGSSILEMIHKDFGGYSQYLVFILLTLSTCLMLSAKHPAGTQRDQQQEVQDGYLCLFRFIKMLNDSGMNFVLCAALIVQPTCCQH